MNFEVDSVLTSTDGLAFTVNAVEDSAKTTGTLRLLATLSTHYAT